MQVMRDAGVVHFDLKGDNILLEPEAGCSVADFWAPPDGQPRFRVVLADFGESKSFASLDGDTTVRYSSIVTQPAYCIKSSAGKAGTGREKLPCRHGVLMQSLLCAETGARSS